MGLFSLFKKNKAAEDQAGTMAEDEGEAAARLAAHSELERQRVQQELQRDIARATAMKIDAIEAAMAADIFDDEEMPWASRPARPPRAAAIDGNTLPLLDAGTTELLGEPDIPAEAAAAETAPVVEEVALLYANGQAELAAELLAAAARDQRDRTVWWMLFDLYQILGRQDAFDSLSIDYASTFETSPPPWNPPAAPDSAVPPPAGLVPTVALSGMLDAGAAAQLARLHPVQDGAIPAATEHGADHTGPLRLDCSRVRGVTPEGCALLLAALRAVQAAERELTVAGAAELERQVGAILAVGRRDEGEAPWLLRLELLRLQHREKDFEESSMDYCVTFEVSPPPFTPPQRVALAPEQPLAAAAADRFVLPYLLAGDASAVIEAILAYAEQYPALVFDCARLARIDYGAAQQLLGALQGLGERRIEFRDLNHLAAALLRLLGAGASVRLFPHKY
ncbi:hypothetical protein [Pseudoduganella violacea]|uniref:ABC-type transporter Mla MlaB component n=1 Tax=Pseudoduganella violacea TaxID=1715466 RepID=A0A7W5BFE9_9BURK|nr:ABC-type transporter Mla MlaB component [Pseudoduganella violacea]